MKYEHIGAIMCVSIILYSVALLTGDAWGPLLAGICLPVIICGCVYYRYKKLKIKKPILTAPDPSGSGGNKSARKRIKGKSNLLFA